MIIILMLKIDFINGNKYNKQEQTQYKTTKQHRIKW